MPLSTLTAPNQIAENSAATPGLWNSPISTLWQNVLQVQRDSSSTGTFLSTNSLFAESGNTVSLFAPVVSVQSNFVAPALNAMRLGATELPSGLTSVFGVTHNIAVATPDVTTAVTRSAAFIPVAYGLSSKFYGASAGGTVSAPSGVGNATAISIVGSIGRDSAGGWGVGSEIRFVTTEAWATGAHGTAIHCYVVANGASARSLAMTVDQDLSVNLQGAFTVVGTINSQTISSAANFTGTVTVATSVLCAVLDSNAATDLLLKRNGSTIITAGASTTTLAGSITTSAPTGGAGAWELGIANAVAPTSPDRTLTVEIGGTAYYIHCKTTND